MKKATKFIAFFLIVLDIILFVTVLIAGKNFPLLNTKGTIAEHERNLMIFAICLMLLVVLPAVGLVFYTAWKYREGNDKTEYQPDSTNSPARQIGLWLIPTLIILILGIVTWQATHALDPFKSLQTNVKPVTIQVVALRWKWLFIYPQQHIATVNFVEFPEKTPITFQLTADAPMNAFWIPQLGGMMYAMTGMVNQTHLMANTMGNFPGSAAEISGAGFEGMRFVAKSVSKYDFDTWIHSTQASTKPFSMKEYALLSQPSTDTPPAYYSITEQDLYNKILAKFLPPQKKGEGMQM